MTRACQVGVLYAVTIVFGGQVWPLAHMNFKNGTADSGDDTTDLGGPAPVANGEGKANATLVFLCRNSDLEGVLSSMGHMERRFNKKYGYPWVFLNEERFTEEFKTFVAFLFFLTLLVF